MRVLTFNGLLTLLLAAVTASSVAAQSLADVARKEEERRKQDPQATKVYTNKDLAPVPPPSTPPPSTSPSADDGKGKAEKDGDKDGDKAVGKDASKKDDATKDQAYWSGRMKALLDAADRDSTLADALQSRINALTTDFINRDDPIQRQQIANDRDRALAELDRLKKQIIDDQKALADFQEEARRAGVPPGWLR